MPSVSFVLYIVTNHHWRSQNKPQGKNWKKEKAGSSRKGIHLLHHHHPHHCLSVQIRRNDRLQTYVCGYLQGLLPQNSQVLFYSFKKNSMVKTLLHKYVQNGPTCRHGDPYVLFSPYSCHSCSLCCVSSLSPFLICGCKKGRRR